MNGASASRRRLIAIAPRFVATVLLCIGVVACGSTQDIETAAGTAGVTATAHSSPTADAPTTSIVEPGRSGTDISEVEGLRGDRLPVIDGKSGRNGWVDRGALLASPGGEPPARIPERLTATETATGLTGEGTGPSRTSHCESERPRRLRLSEVGGDEAQIDHPESPCGRKVQRIEST